MLTVELKSIGNPDFGENPHRPMPGCESDTAVPCVSFEDASRICREWIERNGLGGGNWTGGTVRDEAGEAVASISYNGRIWTAEAV